LCALARKSLSIKSCNVRFSRGVKHLLMSNASCGRCSFIWRNRLRICAAVMGGLAFDGIRTFGLSGLSPCFASFALDVPLINVCRVVTSSRSKSAINRKSSTGLALRVGNSANRFRICVELMARFFFGLEADSLSSLVVANPIPFRNLVLDFSRAFFSFSNVRFIQF